MNIGNWFKKNCSTILTCFGAGGMIATVVLAIKATTKAIAKIQTARIDKGEVTFDGEWNSAVIKNGYGSFELPVLTVIETIQACWKDYIPMTTVGTASLICVFGANALNRHQQAALASAYTALAGIYEGYREKVKQICGVETDALIEKAAAQEKKDAEDDRPPWDEPQTFYLECNDKPLFFERTMEQVLCAEYDVNRYFRLKGQITLNEFLDIFELEHVEGGDLIGWDDYIGEIAFGYQWIDFVHRHFETDDGLIVCSIDLPFPPHLLNEEDIESQF